LVVKRSAIVDFRIPCRLQSPMSTGHGVPQAPLIIIFAVLWRSNLCANVHSIERRTAGSARIHSAIAVLRNSIGDTGAINAEVPTQLVSNDDFECGR
jgi:hypothetical protein